MTNILLVDDYALVRAGIRRLLDDHDDYVVVAESGDGGDALKKARQHHPDVVIMDLGSADLSIFDITRRMNASNEKTRIIVLTSQLDEPFPSRILQAGASACLSKHCSINDLFSALKAVKAGKRYVSTDVARRMAENAMPYSNVSPFIQLSNRELQIMFMFVQGMKVQGISDKLCLSPKTVSTYRYRIFAKLGVRGDVEMTHMALRYGMLQQGKWSRTGYSGEHRQAG